MNGGDGIIVLSVIAELRLDLINRTSFNTTMESSTLPSDTATVSSCFDDAVAGFFTRNGFDAYTRIECDAYARSLFPGSIISLVPAQGYCSYTVSSSSGYIIQFRPTQYELDLGVSAQAGDVFASLAPRVSYSGDLSFKSEHACGEGIKLMHVYCQRRVAGITLSEFRRRVKEHKEDEIRQHRRILVEDLASFFATSYRKGKHRTREDRAPFSKGHVGGSLNSRLKILLDLPDAKMRETVAQLRGSIDALQWDAKWCLTHGDLVPANIMVCPATGHLKGLVDWAEGEWLPFGVGLYGLEEVFGEEKDGGFLYYPDHLELRDLFWTRFTQQAELRLGEFLGSRWVTDLGACRRLGILLWRGLAFDDGKIDRVVDERRDAMELCKLQAFLAAPEPCLSLGYWTRFGLAMRCIWKTVTLTNMVHGSISRPRPRPQQQQQQQEEEELRKDLSKEERQQNRQRSPAC